MISKEPTPEAEIKIQSLTEFLASVGFKPYKDNFYPDKYCFNRRIDAEPKCYTNGDKLSHHIEISCWGDWLGYEIYICANSGGNQWIRFAFYACSVDNLKEDLEMQCEKLTAVWQAVATKN